MVTKFVLAILSGGVIGLVGSMLGVPILVSSGLAFVVGLGIGYLPIGSTTSSSSKAA